MSIPEEEGSLEPPARNDDTALNHRQCPHCDLWFRFDEAKPAGKDAVRCPNCGWIVGKV